MLIEVCFVDTKSDATLYNKVGIDAVAKAIAEAIIGTISGSVENQTPSVEDTEKKAYVKVLANVLNIRKSANWDDSAVCGTVRKNEVFTIVGKETPKGSATPLYKLKSGVYITTSDKYVKYYEK